MRIKLLGFLFLVTGLFLFTRGADWDLGYMLTGAIVAFPGLLLLSPLRTRPFSLKFIQPARKSLPGRNGRAGFTQA
jgi:hypothetical protein